MYRIPYLVFALLITVLAVYAQDNRPLRIEIPTRSGTDPVNYLSCGEQGVLVFYPTVGESGKDSISWSFGMYDKNLQPLWKKQLPLHEDVSYLKGISRKNALYLLFHDTKRNTEGNIFIIMILPDKQIITEHRGIIPEKADVIAFEVLNNVALIGYNHRKNNPSYLSLSLISGNITTTTLQSGTNALLLDLAIDTTSMNIFAVYKEQISSSKNKLFINVFNLNTSYNRLIEVENITEKRIINSAQFIPMGGETGILTGAYGAGMRNSRKPYDYYNDYYNYYYWYNYNHYLRRMQNYDNNRDNTPESDGFYSVKLEPETAPAIQYYNFMNFTNAYKYLTDSDALKTKRRAEKRIKDDELSVSEEKSLSLNYKLLVHPVAVLNGNFILAAEAYYPEYHNVTQMVYDLYGRPIPTTYAVFDGFRYTNAFIAAFDSAGKMAWNNGMEMRDILTQYLNRKLNITNDNGELVLFYNSGGKLSYKIIDRDKVLENTAVIKIASLRSNDQLLAEYLGTIERWYGSTFLATGYQSIRNNFMSETKRNVFYLQKLAYQ